MIGDKKFRAMVDFRGKDKSWTCAREVDAPDEEIALMKLYMDLHKTMKCAFRIWSISEMTENPKLKGDENVGN